MKLLFVENRYATRLYATVAKALATDGHEIHWLVQNHRFAPDFGTVHRLAYPRPSEAKPGLEPYDRLRRTDRGILHFGGTDAHYAAYDAMISDLLASMAPDMVFGESTQFHELLTLSRCRALGIPYLVPASTRYPAGRMCFFAYDTLEPVGGCGESMDSAEALEMVRAIATRTVMPSYMRPAQRRPLRERFIKRAEALRIVAGWLEGERYITPSPLRKWRLQRGQAEAVARWESRAVTALPPELPEGGWVLYPLQMQPEANIDVWGQPWNDQADIVRRAAKALEPSGARLVVKPNPKSKYEMDARLCEVIETTPNVVALSHGVPMGAIFPAVPLVLTVTGTILMECIFSGKPVAVLGSHAMTRFPGVRPLSSPDEVGAVMAEVQAGKAPRASELEAVELIQYLHRTSYPAEYFDPLSSPEKCQVDVMRALIEAFNHTLESLANNPSFLSEQ